MIRIPYSKSDYRTLVEENYFYQDRTAYVQILEDWDATYLLYLRPRRFGKSLLLFHFNEITHISIGLRYLCDS